jgi:hypothetical protein
MESTILGLYIEKWAAQRGVRKENLNDYAKNRHQ